MALHISLGQRQPQPNLAIAKAYRDSGVICTINGNAHWNGVALCRHDAGVHQAMRKLMMDGGAQQVAAVFSVSSWLSNFPRHSQEVHVSQPRQVACWTKASATAGGTIHHADRSGFLPYEAPSLPKDLNEGYPDRFVRKAGPLTGVEPIVQALAKSGLDWAGIDVVTYRNNLNKLSLTPTSLRDEWVIDACLLAPRGDHRTLFLDVQRPSGPERTFPDADRFNYYGYRFESLCTGGENGMVDSTSEYAAIVRLHLGQHRIHMAAEIDAYDPALCPDEAADPPMASFVELKTYKVPANPRQDQNIKRHKYPRWWVQSWLSGTPTIILGGRNEQVLPLDDLTGVFDSPCSTYTVTRQLPNIAAETGQPWNPWQHIGFLTEALSWMRSIADSMPNQHLRFSYTPSQRQIGCTIVADGNLCRRVQATLAGQGP